MSESSFDLQFSLSDVCDDENAVNVKDKALSTNSHPGIYFMTYFLSLYHHSVWNVIIIHTGCIEV